MNGEKYKLIMAIIDLVKSLMIGGVTRLPIITGLSLLAIDKWEVAVFALQLIFKKTDVDTPGVDLGVPGWAGIIMIFGGILLHLYLARRSWCRKNEEEITIFFQNYSTLQAAQFQGELHRLFGMPDVSITAAKNVLAHKDNQRRAFELFRKCSAYVKEDGAWLALCSKWHRLFYCLGSLFALLIFIYALLCLVTAVAEFAQPGVLHSGKYAGEIMIALVLTNLIGLFVLIGDLKRRGTALTLMSMRP